MDTIQNWIEGWKHLPKQGTKEWEDSRKNSIGGSELYTLIKDESRLVKMKTGLLSMPSLLAMRWGNLFENVIRDICKIVFRTEIHEVGSIPSVEVVGKKYSMDGIGYVSLKTHDGGVYRYISLFEFKCPFSRVIKHGGIPDYYKPQILSGMCDLGIPQIGIYVEGVFRLCSFDQLRKAGEHNTVLHTRRETGLERAYGVIGVYAKSITEECDPYVKEFMKGDIDFGDIRDRKGVAMFDKLTELVRKGDVELWHLPVTITPEMAVNDTIKLHNLNCQTVDTDHADNLQKFRGFAQRYHMIGYIPWKLFDINIVTVAKEKNYTLKYKDAIEACLGKIKKINDIEDIGDKHLEYEKMYPPRDTDAAEAEAANAAEVCRELMAYPMV